MEKLYLEDMYNILPKIGDKSIDLAIVDLPYNVTKNKFDKEVIDLDLLWKHLNRVVKERGVVAMFGQGIFTAKLIMANHKDFKYSLVWDKGVKTGFLNANRMPLRQHEDILIFYKKAPTYNPQKVKGKPNHSKGMVYKDKEMVNNNYGTFRQVDNREELGDWKHPGSIISINRDGPSKLIHPTQKPVELMGWLMRSYTDEGDTVLDTCMGSGSSYVASKKLGRDYIGIEKDEEYFNKLISD